MTIATTYRTLFFCFPSYSLYCLQNNSNHNNIHQPNQNNCGALRAIFNPQISFFSTHSHVIHSVSNAASLCLLLSNPLYVQRVNAGNFSGIKQLVRLGYYCDESFNSLVHDSMRGMFIKAYSFNQPIGAWNAF